MKLSEIELPVLHRSGSCRLPEAPVWLMLGYPSATAEARRLAAWLEGVAVQSNGALPIVVVMGPDRAAASQAAADPHSRVRVYLDQPDLGLLRKISCCERPFVAVVRDDVVIAIGCTKYLDDLAGVVQIAVLEAGIQHLDARRMFAWNAEATSELAA